MTQTTSPGGDAHARLGRGPLSRERILQAALELIDREGLESLSMRRLGAELGVGAMALYNYVPSKEALLEGVAETLMEEIDLASAEDDDWTRALAGLATSFRDVMLSHPNALTLIETKPAITPEAFRPIELSLSILRKAGFDPEQALQAHWALVGYVTGHISFQCNNPLHTHDDRHAEEIALRKANLPFEQFPRLYECMPYLARADFDAAFRRGLRALIEGLRMQLAENSP